MTRRRAASLGKLHRMDKEKWAELGFKLAAELETLAESYHVKSDNYEMLSYEAATVREEAQDLLSGNGVQEHLKNLHFSANGGAP